MMQAVKLLLLMIHPIWQLQQESEFKALWAGPAHAAVAALLQRMMIHKIA